MHIRPGRQSDIEPLNEIYNYYIRETHFTFDLKEKTLNERTRWLSQFAPGTRHQLFVATVDERVVGYASSTQFRPKQAYETSVETSIYLHPDSHHRGVGTRLYETLFAALLPLDVHRAYAGITQPNAASAALHKKFGFVPLGTYREVGRKFGRYWSVDWFEKQLD